MRKTLGGVNHQWIKELDADNFIPAVTLELFLKLLLGYLKLQNEHFNQLLLAV